MQIISSPNCVHLWLPTAHAPWKTLKFDVENMLGGGVLWMDVFWHLIDKERPLVSLLMRIFWMIRPKNVTHADFFCTLSSNLDKKTLFNHVHFLPIFLVKIFAVQTSSLEIMHHLAMLANINYIKCCSNWLRGSGYFTPWNSFHGKFKNTYNFEIVYPDEILFLDGEESCEFVKESPHIVTF